jgi:hypothetical protein
VLSIAIFMGFTAFTYELYMAISGSKQHSTKSTKGHISDVHYSIYAFVSSAGFLSLFGMFILSQILD